MFAVGGSKDCRLLITYCSSNDPISHWIPVERALGYIYRISIKILDGHNELVVWTRITISKTVILPQQG